MIGILATVTASDKRKNIMLLILRSGPQSLEDIRNELHAPTTSILPQIRILEEHNLIRKEQKQWELTPLGKIITGDLLPLTQITDTIDKNNRYWSDHPIDDLPTEFIRRIHELGDYTVISSDQTQTFIPKETFREQMGKTSSFRGMSAMIHPDHLHYYRDLARTGGDISHITTKKAYTTLLSYYPEEMAEISRIKPDAFIISAIDFNWECVITDDLLILSLFLKSGSMDPNNDLISADESARRWGYDLYNYYLSAARVPGSSCGE